MVYHFFILPCHQNEQNEKTSVCIIYYLVFFFGNAQNSEYSITSYMNEGFKAPNTHYIGEAWLNVLMQAEEDFGYNLTQATFGAD